MGLKCPGLRRAAPAGGRPLSRPASTLAPQTGGSRPGATASQGLASARQSPARSASLSRPASPWATPPKARTLNAGCCPVVPVRNCLGRLQEGVFCRKKVPVEGPLVHRTPPGRGTLKPGNRVASPGCRRGPGGAAAGFPGDHVACSNIYCIYGFDSLHECCYSPTPQSPSSRSSSAVYSHRYCSKRWRWRSSMNSGGCSPVFRCRTNTADRLRTFSSPFSTAHQ